MRVFVLAALLVLHPQVWNSAAAQDTSRTVPDSARPMDTEPSIPVVTPDRGRSEPATRGSGAGPVQSDPDSPVSPDTPARDIEQPRGAPAAGAESGLATDPRDPAATGAEPYAAGLPQRATPARTLRAHWHVYIAFAVVWALLFGYVVSLGRRFGRLEKEIERLRR